MQARNNINDRHAGTTEVNICQADTLQDIHSISKLAEDIWYQHYMPIIGAEQVSYMLAQFQSPAAIRRQIDNGYRYHLLRRQQMPVAYFAWLPDGENNSLHLSKLYVAASQRQNGLGRHIIAFICDHCRRHGFKQIWLTVNRHNQDAICFYRKMGFENAGELVQDIGGGFVMDDFKLVKHLP